MCALARDLRVDALCGAGNLYNQSSATRATGDLLQEGFESIDPIPVCLAPGRTDWFHPTSRYADVRWSRNVHVFSEARFAGYELRCGGTIWGVAHVQAVHEVGFLADIPAGHVWPGTGPHVALFHGVDFSDVTAGSVASAPFHREDIRAGGFDHALVGHVDRSRYRASGPDVVPYTYGGGPGPGHIGRTRFGGPVLVTIGADGTVGQEWFDFAPSSPDPAGSVAASKQPSTVDHVVEPSWFTRVLDGPGPIARPDPDRLTVLTRFVRDVEEGSFDDGRRDRVLRAGLWGLDEQGGA